MARKSILVLVVSVLSLVGVGVWAQTRRDPTAVTTMPEAQQPAWGFSVLTELGQPVIIAKLKPEPYKPGSDPTVYFNLDGVKTVRNKTDQIISGFGFYGWSEGAVSQVAVIARLPPEGAENKFYPWSELKGRKPRLEVFATYKLTDGETRIMEELRALGLQEVVLRAEANQPK